MVFGWLFGKKKTDSQQQQQNANAQQQQAQKQQAQQKQSKPHNNTQQSDQLLEDSWIYEYLLQYLTSPLWKVPIYEFLDENCIVFDDEEENKFSYTEIHNKFKKLIEGMIETLMAEIGIDEQKLLQYIEIGLKSPHHKKVFEQLLIVDNFLVFKKLMVKRNKELELEALKEMMKNEQEEPVPEDEEKLKLASMEAERAEIEHAIQMSLAAEEEIKKLHDVEDEELKKVLEMSKITYEKEAQTRSQIQKQQQEQTPVPDQSKVTDFQLPQTHVEQAPQKVEQVQQNKKEVSPVKQDKPKEAPKPQEKEPEVEEVKQQEPQFKPLNKLPVLKAPSNLPPLVNKKYEKPIDDLLADRATLLQQLDNYKAVEEKLKSQQVPEKQEEEGEKEESLEERKKRLLAQRELLRKKKQQQREQELKDYKEGGEETKKAISSQQSVLLTENQPANTENLSQQELQKRQNLISKIKQNM
ncbi:ARF-like 2-binding protein BART protein (macronuclear) [Tetrahymena thermophila SB210]|uniref:Cilia- and flagella-associated protein 36 n=1 Tax=Tetrahymena thermophila (strain SB210) TaxID=312017 RepID=I7MLH4_TETTS|nr:ARF-like 2-binding protein BART protein [Tetrahymena thermophila SB210]EAS02105.3 ARF-like 2-binding protein BART protein [Tetrahymena thermophila SB210]|eukprot:XP_001022350.3 ARF-like 2-binding protein BART protein [Tetrahymena thermophila SB210]